MKIKEVIEKTGLTDRAIRLYIDEGLTAPSIEESYSGRKKIEFSETDVERLKNVAILRKAGFSIPDIKSISDNSENAKEIVENLIRQTEENIENETEIVRRLKNISFDEEVTMKTICNSLSETVEEKEVPKEDIKLTPIEKVLKIVTILLSCTLLIHVIKVIYGLSAKIFNFRYIKPIDDIGTLTSSLLYLGWVVIAILLITVIIKNIGKRFNRKTKKSWILFIISVAGILSMWIITIILIFMTITPFCSQTTDPENYLKFDEVLTELDESSTMLDGIYKIFPRKIPIETKENHPRSIKYFYEYTFNWDDCYKTYDVCAEWMLTDTDYKVFKKSLSDDSNVVHKGDWTLIYYEGYGKVRFDYIKGDKKAEKCDDELKYSESKNEFEIENWDGYVGNCRYKTQYKFLICAYNDKEQKVRYIASSSDTGFGNRKGGPYYLSLDW